MQPTHQAMGILGGTFDPIHIGHLRMALEIHASLHLSTVHLIPCSQPVHRSQPAASPQSRLSMLTCAIQHEPALVADDREIRRGGQSYMIDTLKEMRSEFPSTPLCLILGIDAFLGFPSWNQFSDIIDLSHIIVAYRPQFQLPNDGLVAELLRTHLQHDQEYLHNHLNGAILLRPITALDVSASYIREQIAMGGNPRYLLPETVYEYIQKNGIYLDEIRRNT